MRAAFTNWFRVACFSLVIPAGSALALATAPAARTAETTTSDTPLVRYTAGSASPSLAGVTCWYQSTRHFYAASVIKVTILGALLRKTQERKRQLTTREKHDAWLMITRSDNSAANALWADVGYKFMQHFLKMTGRSTASARSPTRTAPT